MTNRQARAFAAARRELRSHNGGRISAQIAFEEAFKSKPAHRLDVFGSVARRTMQDARDAETTREPVPSAFTAGRGVLNLRPIAERVAARTPVRTEEELVLRRLRKRLRKGRGRGAGGLGPIRPKYRTVARALVLAGYFG